MWNEEKKTIGKKREFSCMELCIQILVELYVTPSVLWKRGPVVDWLHGSLSEIEVAQRPRSISEYRMQWIQSGRLRAGIMRSDAQNSVQETTLGVWLNCRLLHTQVHTCFMGTIVAVSQYTGKNISCNGFEKFGEDFSQDYCWTQGLYTIKEAYDLPESQIPYPGIIPENVPACREHSLKNGDISGISGSLSEIEVAQRPRSISEYRMQWIQSESWHHAVRRSEFCTRNNSRRVA
eukprot:sb/3469267/